MLDWISSGWALKWLMHVAKVSAHWTYTALWTGSQNRDCVSLLRKSTVTAWTSLKSRFRKNSDNRESCNSSHHMGRPSELWLPKYRKNLANCNSWPSQMWIFLILNVKSSAPGHIWGECKHAWMNLRQFKSLETSQPEQPRRKSVTLPGSVPDHYVLRTTSSWLTVPVIVCGVDSSYRCLLP